MRTLLLVTMVAVLAVGAIAAAATSSEHYTASVSSTSVGDGAQSPSGAVAGATAKGTFSGKLGGASGHVARAVAAKLGISLAQLVKGGSYKAKYDIAASGDLTAVAKVTLKAAAAGTLCVKLTEKHGKYAPGSSFIPTTGTVTALGGTGRSAKLRGSATFSLKSLTGSATEQSGVTGSAHVSAGAAKGFSAACRAL